MKEAEAREKIKNLGCAVIDEFTNPHGEKFVLYGYRSVKSLIFVTGDEFDWELEGYTYVPSIKSFAKVFLTTEQEAELADNIANSYYRT